jgi:hypothetical protein
LEKCRAEEVERHKGLLTPKNEHVGTYILCTYNKAKRSLFQSLGGDKNLIHPS